MNEWVKIFAEISEFAISHLLLWVDAPPAWEGTKCSVIDFQNVQMQKFSRIFLTWMRYGAELKLEKTNCPEYHLGRISPSQKWRPPVCNGMGWDGQSFSGSKVLLDILGILACVRVCAAERRPTLNIERLLVAVSGNLQQLLGQFGNLTSSTTSSTNYTTNSTTNSANNSSANLETNQKPPLLSNHPFSPNEIQF